MKDIAREAGCAVGTVSRVLNDCAGVSASARDRVMEVVHRTGFRPNSNAKRLKQQRGHAVAVVVKGTYGLLFADLLGPVRALLRDRGYSVLLTCLSQEENEAQAAAAVYAEHTPLGVLFFGCRPESCDRELAAVKCPCVVLAAPAGEPGCANLSSIAADDAQAARLAAEYLLAAGHRRIGVIADDPGRARLEHFCQVMAEHDIQLDPDLHGISVPSTLEGGCRGARTLLERDAGLTAFFATGDVLAIGAMRGAGDLGLRVPEDLSVMGCGGAALGGYCLPRLTTVGCDGEALARLGVERLLAAIEQAAPAVHETVPLTLVAGESVAGPGDRSNG